MREWDSVIEDQGSLGSCAGNAIVNAYELQVRYLYPDKFAELSRLFVYYNSRLLENTVMEDAGVYLRNGMRAVQKYGICTEKLWPYDIAKFSVKPTDECYQAALERTITAYQSLSTIDDVLHAVNDNKPVVIGVTVYDNFDYISKSDSVIQKPDNSDQGGGHAMTVVGYDMAKRQFLVKNSFGRDWGDSGYAWLPFDYAESEGFEKWVFDISDQR